MYINTCTYIIIIIIIRSINNVVPIKGLAGRPGTSWRQQRHLPPLLLVIALVPLAGLILNRKSNEIGDDMTLYIWFAVTPCVYLQSTCRVEFVLLRTCLALYSTSAK